MKPRNYLQRSFCYGLLVALTLWSAPGKAQDSIANEPDIYTILRLLYQGKTSTDKLIAKEKILSAATTLILVNDYLVELRKNYPSVQPVFCRPKNPVTLGEAARGLSETLALFDDLNRSNVSFEYGLLVAFVKRYPCPSLEKQ